MDMLTTFFWLEYATWSSFNDQVYMYVHKQDKKKKSSGPCDYYQESVNLPWGPGLPHFIFFVLCPIWRQQTWLGEMNRK